MDRVSLNRRQLALGVVTLSGLGAAFVAASPAAAVTATEPDWRDYEDAGMTGRRSYESPNHGVTVSWSRDWELDAEVDEAVAAADDEYHTDTLNLAHDPAGNVAYFQLAFMDRGTTTVADQMDWTVSDDGLTYFFGDTDGGRVLASGSTRLAGQVWLQYADNSAVIAVSALRSGTTLVSCVMACAPEDAEEAWAASADVLVDDDNVFQIVDWAEIADAMAVATPEAKSGGSHDTSDVDPHYAEAGLTSATTYESPQYGYSVEWSEPWSMRPPTDTWGAVTSVSKTGDDTLVLDYLMGTSGEFLATLVIDASPQNDLTRDVILSSEAYAKVDNIADTVKVTLIDSKKGAREDTLAVWSQEIRGAIQYRLIAIDSVGDGVQRQTRLNLHNNSSDGALDDFTTLMAAITMDGDPILLGYTAEEFGDAIANA